MAISPARVAAFNILLRVETEDAYAQELLHAPAMAKLSALDRNLAMQITMGVLRWQARLDASLAKFASGKNDVAKLDPEVRTALRMAAFQFAHLDRIPVSAAVNDSVELVKRARKRSAAPFVNVVLRKVAESSGAERQKPSTVGDAAEALAHPLWLVERWQQAYGLANAIKICEADQAQPATTLRMPIKQTAATAVDAELSAAGIALAPGELLTSARRVIAGDVTATAAYRERRIGIQDEASQLVAAMVGRGQRILDCCAAPGGKTQAIAQHNPAAKIVAAELHPQRARMMREFITAQNVEVVNADVSSLPATRDFDRILVDVPCSGTGTLARNPEIKWRLKPEDLGDLHRKQAKILSSALEQVAAQGRVVYSTCSLEPEENEQVVEEVLRERKEFRLVDAADVLRESQGNGELSWKNVGAITSGPFLRTMQGVHPCDGFFAAVIARVD